MRANRSYSKTRTLETELAEAREFLRRDPRGRRLQAAEHTLLLLVNDELPRMKHFIFNAAFDLRRVPHRKGFEKTLNGNPKFADLLKQSKTTAYAKINFDEDSLQFVLFYEKDLNQNEAALYSNAFGQVIATTYASLGLDMNGFNGQESMELVPQTEKED
jgi:hypothetical protein